jgi:hypothetical protein
VLRETGATVEAAPVETQRREVRVNADGATTASDRVTFSRAARSPLVVGLTISFCAAGCAYRYKRRPFHRKQAQPPSARADGAGSAA